MAWINKGSATLAKVISAEELRTEWEKEMAAKAAAKKPKIKPKNK